MANTTCTRCGAELPSESASCPQCGALRELAADHRPTLQDLRHPMEQPAFMALAIFGALTWIVLTVVTFGILLLFALGLIVLNWISVRLFRAYLLTHAVRVTPDHFPHVHNAIEAAMDTLQYSEPLEVYVMEGSLLNAFVAAGIRTRCVVLFSQLLEGVDDDEAALRGLVGHELSHLSMGHLRWRWLAAGGAWIPLLFLCWSRMCELTADRCGEACAGSLEAYEKVLAILAVSWRLVRHVRPGLLVAQANEAQDSVLARLVELTSTHPPLVKRVAEIRCFATGAPQIAERNPLTTLGAVLLLPLAGLRTATSFAGIAGVVFVVAILAAVLFPVFAQAREAARAQYCVSNVKQIDLALLMYAQDYDETLPPAQPAYTDLLLPYVRRTEVYHCPSDSRPDEVSYAYNAELAGKSLVSIQSPQETLTFYEAEDEIPVNRHLGGSVVGYLDGHVRLIGAKGSAESANSPLAQ